MQSDTGEPPLTRTCLKLPKTFWAEEFQLQCVFLDGVMARWPGKLGGGHLQNKKKPAQENGKSWRWGEDGMAGGSWIPVIRIFCCITRDRSGGGNDANTMVAAAGEYWLWFAFLC